MIVPGRVSHEMARPLRQSYDQMPEPGMGDRDGLDHAPAREDPRRHPANYEVLRVAPSRGPRGRARSRCPAYG
jgi:hypothetical protein